MRTTSLRGARTSTWIAASPARVTSRRPQSDVLDADRVDGRLHDVERCAGVDERTEEHVAARAGLAAEPGEAHVDASVPYGCARRATRAAKTPAPKPLSMLHTTTPGAQELSIASSAARPPYDAP